ncbi:MAG: tetratricopeptide repeat protein [bacterium]
MLFAAPARAQAGAGAPADAANPAQDVVHLVCPVDGTQFDYAPKKLPRGHLIQDRDFCLRLVPDLSSFATTELYSARLAVCPKCGFCAEPASALWKGESAASRWYRDNIAPKDGQGASKPSSSPWDEFERAAKLIEKSGAPERDSAVQWLNAAYALRTGFWSEHPDWARVAAKLESDLRTATAGSGSVPSPKSLYEDSIEIPSYFGDLLLDGGRAYPAMGILSLYWLARGETARAKHALNSFAELASAAGSAPANSGAALMSELTGEGLLEKMRGYQENAISAFEEALNQGQLTVGEVPVVYYHLAELYRRTGDLGMAERYYNLAKASPALNPDVKKRTDEGLALLGADEKLYSTLDDYVSGRAIDELPLEDISRELPVPEAPAEAAFSGEGETRDLLKEPADDATPHKNEAIVIGRPKKDGEVGKNEEPANDSGAADVDDETMYAATDEPDASKLHAPEKQTDGESADASESAQPEKKPGDGILILKREPGPEEESESAAPVELKPVIAEETPEEAAETENAETPPVAVETPAEAEGGEPTANESGEAKSIDELIRESVEIQTGAVPEGDVVPEDPSIPAEYWGMVIPGYYIEEPEESGEGEGDSEEGGSEESESGGDKENNQAEE